MNEAVTHRSLFIVIDADDIENIQDDENVSKYLLTSLAVWR